MSGDEEWFDDFEEQSDASLTDGEPPATPSASTDGGLSDREGEGSPVTSQWQTRPSLYTIIDKPSLQQIQIEALDQVQAILGCSVTVARALLTYFSWDAESVLSTIAERGEEEVYRRAGVLSKSQGEDTGGGAAEQSGSPSQPEGTILCSVCFMDAGPGEWAAMRCGHAFCRDCWQQHLSIGIREGMSRQLRCMAPRCGVLCDEDVVHDVMARSPELLEKFEQALIGASFAQCLQ